MLIVMILSVGSVILAIAAFMTTWVIGYFAGMAQARDRLKALESSIKRDACVGKIGIVYGETGRRVIDVVWDRIWETLK